MFLPEGKAQVGKSTSEGNSLSWYNTVVVSFSWGEFDDDEPRRIRSAISAIRRWRSSTSMFVPAWQNASTMEQPPSLP